jgi:putative ABC transport system substrate-binding protein
MRFLPWPVAVLCFAGMLPFSKAQRVLEAGMRRRKFLTGVGAVAIATGFGRARAAARIFRIGWVTAQPEASLAPFLGVFKAALVEFGYRENDNLEIDYRYGDDDLLRVAPLASN